MNDPARTIRALRGLSEAPREGIAESWLAYNLTSHSYSYSAMKARIAAGRALKVLLEAPEDPLSECEGRWCVLGCFDGRGRPASHKTTYRRAAAGSGHQLKERGHANGF